MGWDFETDQDFQTKLDWVDSFVREEIEPIDLVWPGLAYETPTDALRKVIDPLKQRVRDEGLWACHLGPELGGKGYGQVNLALLNEILGRSQWAPIIFGCQAPDTGNAEIIAHYGTDEQKAKYLQPLLDGELFSSYSMTEPQGGSDPTQFVTRAERDGDEWVINGWKFFSSNADSASFLIVMVVTNPEVSAYQGMSMFLVPTDTPGVNIVRNVGLMGEPLGGVGHHALIHYDNVHVPADNLLGGEGQAFAIAQTRLGGGRIHHAMRTVGLCQKAIDMMCERGLSRETQGSLLADKQSVQNMIADSYAELTQFRLFLLYTVWTIDRYKDYRKVRQDIAAVKVLMPQVLQNIVQRSIQVHGALGVSNELPLGGMWMSAPVMALVDGPTEVHKVTVARQMLKRYKPSDDLWPTEHLPKKVAAACEKFAEYLEHEVANSPSDVARTAGLVDTDRLARWMDERGLPGRGEPLTSEFISGGASNEIFSIRRNEHLCVLRRPPAKVPEGRNETMLREYRVLHALNGTTVPHPEAIAVCDDTNVLGAAFYLMSHIDGWSPISVDGWPSPFDTDLDARRGLAFELCDGIAQLAMVDWRQRGLDGFGKPDGFHDRQVDRWLSHLSKFQFREIPGIDVAAEWLRAHRPSQWEPGIIHGDYQFANVMFAHGAPARLAAIVDWEMATIGDPLLDLGWVMMGWPDPGEAMSAGYVDYTGMPSRAEMLDHYERVRGRPTDEIDYYVILARFKIAIVLEGGYARIVQGNADNPKMEQFGGVVLDMARPAPRELAQTTPL